VTVLRDLGLLGQEPVDVDGVSVVPKNLLDALLYPRVKLADGERDLTLFRVEVTGDKQGQPRRYQIEMVDRYDKALGFTSMARTTAFTGAILARMVACGELRARGVQTPERVVTGRVFERLVGELDRLNIRFELRTECVDILDAHKGPAS
jgi:lysine 6-dehydrogenase